MNERLKERIQNFAGFDRAVPMPLSNTTDDAVPMPTADTPNNAVPMPSGDPIDPMDRIENMRLIRDIQALGGRLSDAEISMYMNMTPEGIQQVRERENIDQMLNSMIEGTLEKPKNIFDYDVDIDGRDFQFEGEGGLDLMRLRQRLGLEPMYDATGTEFDEVTAAPAAEALSMMGRGGDTELAHLEPGDVVVPPQLLDADPMLADMLEDRMRLAGVDPTSRVAGM